MYITGGFLILLAGLLSPTLAIPHLQNNGYRDILIKVGNDVPDEDANTVVEMIKELLTEASEDMFYAMNARAYIQEVTIMVPNHWTTEMVPSLTGEIAWRELYQEGDIQIGRKNRLRGEAPYSQLIRGDCGAPEYPEHGEARGPIQVSLEYLKSLHAKRDEMTVKYGPMGKLIVQEFTKYHHGIHEEYGYPGKQDSAENAEQFPSLYLHSFMDQDDIRKMAVVPNYCADFNLTGVNRNYKVEGDHLVQEACEINDETGEIMSPSCYFYAGSTDQEAYSSIGSYQYSTVKIDEVMFFCDGSEYIPHNHESPNLHNDYCEGASQWETIESHREFADGNNPPVYIEDTRPIFHIKSQAPARFVLVLDYSNSMAQYARMEHLKITSIRWITQLKPGTQVAVVRFGTYAELVHDWVDPQDGTNLQQLIEAINAIIPNGGGSCMSCGLKKAEELMLDPNSPGHAGVVMTVLGSKVIDGTNVGDPSVWGSFQINSIRVLTILMGTKTEADIDTLARQTNGKVFTVNYDGSDLDGPFDWASQTYIPAGVADNYEWFIEDILITGRDSLSCHFECIKFTIALDDQTNRNVVVNIRMALYDGEVSDYVESASVTNLDTGYVVDGFTLSIDDRLNQVLLQHLNPGPGNFQVYITLKKRLSVTFAASAKVTGHRSSPNSEPYTVECKYPDELKQEKYLITGFVKQGNSVVKGATVYARISKSQDEDPSGLEQSCIIKLRDDGQQQTSGDVFAHDGVQANILDPRACWNHPPSNGERMQVMCTMVSSPDTKVTDNTFFTKRKPDVFNLPNESDSVIPYCCGTSNQDWSFNRDVKFVRRETYNTTIKVEMNVLQKDWFKADFGPPGRIANLRATRVGDESSGIVELKWTGAGDDPAYGIPASYNVHYSTKRSNLYTKNLEMSSRVTSRMLRAGSLEPVPIGQKMSITVSIPDLEVPGTYHFAVRAVDKHGQEGKASNIVTVNFHDGSPVVRDISPLQVHGIQKYDVPLIEKLRKVYKDERMVQGYLKKAAKTKQMVWEAENSVMEKRLRKWFGDNEKVLANIINIINIIKTNPEQRNLYKKFLL